MTLTSLLAATVYPSLGSADLVRAAEPQVGRLPESEAAPPPEFDVTDRVELSAEAQGQQELSDEEQQQVDELKRRDAEVREHEAAHLAAAGAHARGGASFEYATGPDGRQYATGGEVQIDTSPVPDDPNATIAKMQAVQRAALAPQQPSAQDRRVAADAQAAIQEAQAEKARQASADQGEQAVSEPEAAESGAVRQRSRSGSYSAAGRAQLDSDFARQIDLVG
jgi:hypothetical protein